ncbi:hypothetical protein [Neobacillus sp. YIM B06451]|uniref:hypothetical protein n=1 Tax=Neobacillus sp. YIM B06451 TaxID=3070994 RepID=UPI002930D142|nr:hypothetical protein [Neobacillus sp. YIM B06451]
MRRVLLGVAMALMIMAMYPESGSAQTKVMWKGSELKRGQIGLVTILESTPLFMLEGTKQKVLRILKKGETYRIYTYKKALLGLGGGYYVSRDKKIKYETPSKDKMALVGTIPASQVDFNKKAAREQLAKLGWKDLGGAAGFNPYGNYTPHPIKIFLLESDPFDAEIIIDGWYNEEVPEYNKVPPMIKSALPVILKTGAGTVYTMIDESFKGSTAYLGKTFTFGDRKVKFVDTGSKLSILIGKPGSF